MKGRCFAFLRKAAALGSGFALTVATTPSIAAPPGLPAGGSVAAGSATISSPNQTSTLVTQSSQKALINWQSFGIAAGSSVTFQQPNAAAIALNRVLGSDPSVINGNLFANGQVWLINGNGILFGRGSQINVGGLIATTSDMRDSDFLAGRYNFDAPGNPNASVVNQGSIKAATGGSAVLSAPHVVNEGVIEANLGKVVLGGADAFSVDFDGDNLIRYAITAPVTQTPKDADGKPAGELVANSGTISAQGGKVLLTARAARNVVDNVINSTGIIEATSASIVNGEIVLDAGDGSLVAGGTLDASGKNAGETGGTVKLIGDAVTVTDLATIDASGDAGGGRIEIGGALRGAGPEPNATAVTVGTASIAVDAVTRGDGGTAVVYSTGETKVGAAISAKGGASGGNGGTVETSGHDLSIADSTTVDTSARVGTTGVWLLDPVNIIVGNGGTTQLAGGVLGKDTDAGIDDRVAPSTIIAALATTSVRLEATNDITVLDPLLYTSANSLTFLAQHDVNFRADVQNAGAGGILAVGGWNGTATAADILANFNPGTYGVGGGRVRIDGTTTSGTIVAVGSAHGTTTIAAAALNITAGTSAAQLGYHGAGAPGDVTAGGNLDVHVGDLTLTGGTTRFNYAQLGNGHAFGNLLPGVNVTGDITVNASGTTSLTNSRLSNGGFAWIGNAAGVGFTASGNVRLTTGDIATSGVGPGIADYIQADIGSADVAGSGGDIAIVVTSSEGRLPLNQGVFANSTHSLTLNSGGDVVIDHTLQNINTGAIAITGGTVTIGGHTAVSDVVVGSKLASVSVTSTSGDITIAAVDHSAQLGFHGEGQGAITVTSAGSVILQGGSSDSEGIFAQIGNGGGATAGGSPISGSVAGDITVTAANDVLLLAGSGPNAYVQIGHGGPETDLTVEGQISVSAGGAVTLAGGGDTGTYAQIGHGGANSTVNILSDAILVTAGGDVTLAGGEGETAYAQIGDGGAAASLTASQFGAITVLGANIEILAGFGSVTYGQIGHGGEDSVFQSDDPTSAGAITVSGSNVTLVGSEQDGIQYAQIGSGGAGSIGTASGDIFVTAADTVALAGGFDNTAYAQIGHGGANSTVDATGAISVQAGEDILLAAGGFQAYTLIGHGGLGSIGTGSGDISLTAGGNVMLSGGNDSGAYAQIGHGGTGFTDTGWSSSGGITVFANGGVHLNGGNGTGTYVQIGHGGDGATLTADGDILVNASGGLVLSGGNGEDSYAQIGHGGANTTTTILSDSITVTAGDDIALTGGDGTNAYAQIGDGGAGASLDVSQLGAITVTGDIIDLLGGFGSVTYAQIGHGGEDSILNGGDVSLAGAITVSGTDVTLTGSEFDGIQYAQIGNGGAGSIGNAGGDIFVTADASEGLVALSGGFDNTAYAQIGHGGANSSIEALGNIAVTGSSVLLSGGGDGAYTQIGHGGANSTGSASGDIAVTASEFRLQAGNDDGAYAQAGHGGKGSSGSNSGAITVLADTTLEGGDGQGAYSQIGHGGEGSSGSNDGFISVQGLLQLYAGDGEFAYAMIGQGGENTSGVQTGDIDIQATGNTTLDDRTDSDGGRVWIGNFAGQDGSSSGNVSFITAGFFAPGDPDQDSGVVVTDTNNVITDIILGDIQGGNFTLGLTGTSGFTLIDRPLVYNSPYDLTILSGTSIDIANSILNTGSGALTIAAGWDPSVLPQDVVDLHQGFGVGNAAVIVHGLTGYVGPGEGVAVDSAGGTAVASKSGATTVMGARIVLDADQYFAQIGYHNEHDSAGTASGTIDLITAATGTVADPTAANCMTGPGNICLSSGTEEGAYAQIGHLGLGTAGTASGPITIEAAGNLILSAGGQVGGLPGMGAGTIERTYAQIGNGAASRDEGSVDTVSGDIAITAAGQVFLGSSAEPTSPAWIGNIGANAGFSGSVSLTAQALVSNSHGNPLQSLLASDIAGGNVTIALTNSSRPLVFSNEFIYSSPFNLTVATTGSIDLLASLQNNGSGAMTFVAGWDAVTTPSVAATSSTTSNRYGLHSGSVTIGGSDAGDDVAIGSQSGTTTIAGAELTLDASNGYAQLGHHGAATGNIVVNLTAGLDLFAGDGETGAFAQVGHGGAGTNASNSGNITLNAVGAVSLVGGDDTAYAQIGHGGAGTNTGLAGATEIGNINLSAASFSVIAGTDGAYAQIGHGGANSRGNNGLANQGIVINSRGSVILTGIDENAYAQIGNGGQNSSGNNAGSILVNASSGVVGLLGGSDNSYAQIGHGGGGSSGNNTGAISILALNDALVGLAGGSGQDAYAQIGHGGASSNGHAAAATDDGNISISAASLVLTGGSGNGAYAQIGQGGENSHAANGLAGQTINVTSRGAVLLTGQAQGAYAQIGNGGKGAVGANIANVTVTGTAVTLSGGVANPATGLGGQNAYAQLGNGGQGSTGANTGNVTLTGTSVTLTGGGQNAYAQIGDGGQGSTGANTGNVTLTGAAVTLTGGQQNAYAQIGAGGQGSTGGNIGNLSVTSSTGAVGLTGGAGLAAYAQLGNGGEGAKGSNSGSIAATANGGSGLTLNGGAGQYAYAQLGHGGAESNTDATANFSDSGAITATGASVTLAAGAGAGSYSQIGNGGFESGKNLGSASATYSENVTVTSASSIRLLGGAGNDAYAQIGNAGSKSNSNSAAGATGTTSGDILVTASPAGGSVTMTAGSGTDAYVQIGNGGFSANAPTAAPATSFTIGGNVTVTDLLITGGNSGANAYGQIGNGDITQTGTGNVSGNVNIIAAVGTVTLTSGTATNSSAGIANATKPPGTVSGTVTRGDIPPPPPPPPPPAEPEVTDVAGVQGVLTVLAQTPPQTTLATLTAGPPAVETANAVMTMAMAMPTEGTLESQEEPQASDTVASSVGNSLSGEPGAVPSRTISLIGGLLRQSLPTVGAVAPVGVPPANQDFSSSGNEAFWQ